jgi:hypothetical protein
VLTSLSERKLIVLFVLGFRMKAIAILGREVMLPLGLVGMGLDTMDLSTLEVKEVRSNSGYAIDHAICAPRH